MVNQDSSATQAKIDGAVTDLNVAISTFQSSMITSGVNKTMLSQAITNANALYNNAIEGTANGQYPVGSKAILKYSIDSAIVVNSDSAATQQNVDYATIALNNATNKFQAKKITIGVNKTILNQSIINAQSLLTNSTEGTASGQYPVGSKSELQTAMYSAISVNSDTSANQNQIDIAVTNLNSAISTFQAKKNSTTPTEPRPPTKAPSPVGRPPPESSRKVDRR